MKTHATVRALLKQFQSRPTLRAGSLITTVFGDAVAPRGGEVWLGSLIRAMASFGISERLVRTSVFRLVRDGWLQSEQIGRRSYYGLTASGRERFDQATQKIYGDPSNSWDGKWCLLLLSGLDTSQRELARKEFAWLGFAALSANLLAHPSPVTASLTAAIRRLDTDHKLVVLEGSTLQNDAAMLRMAHEQWEVEQLNRAYGEFVAMFRPVLHALGDQEGVGGETAFVIRTLLIQEYRKIMLRDPMLAQELLPTDWHGGNAYQLCRNLYRRVHQSADDYVGDVLEAANGDLSPPDKAYWQRFGGLK